MHVNQKLIIVFEFYSQTRLICTDFGSLFVIKRSNVNLNRNNKSAVLFRRKLCMTVTE